ncbi:hypothetical protein BDW22DRAFT_672183 [Trametopsis cervina]|nr:hypothetical protein BDW22DRAFT_672183 [Trametopsis cervina]
MSSPSSDSDKDSMDAEGTGPTLADLENIHRHCHTSEEPIIIQCTIAEFERYMELGEKLSSHFRWDYRNGTLTVFMPTVTHQAILAFMIRNAKMVDEEVRSLRTHTSSVGPTHTESDDVFEVATLIPAPAHVRSGRIKKRQQPLKSKARSLPDHVEKPRPLLTADLIQWVPRIVVEVVALQALENAQQKALDWLNQKGGINVALIVHAPEAGQFRNPPDVQITFSALDIKNEMPYSRGHLGPYVHFLEVEEVVEVEVDEDEEDEEEDEEEEEAFSIHDSIPEPIYPYSERYKEYGWTWHEGMKEVTAYLYYRGSQEPVRVRV